MNDLKELLGLALADGHGPAASQRVDPSADLARGRRWLRRRRLSGLAGVTAAVLCGALVPLALHGAPGGTARPSAAPSAAARPTQSRASAGPAKPTRKIALVAWLGTQPPGYQVREMPKGWVVQASTPYVLTIAPASDRSKDPDDFVGKLVVMLQSKDVTSPPTLGTPQPVNGRAGMFDVQGDTQILTFQRGGRQLGGHPGAGVPGLE